MEQSVANIYLIKNNPTFQGCGSGLDPDSVTLCIRIRIGNPDPGSGSRGKKVKKFQWKNALLVITPVFLI
jgi:hypothetical protein